MKNILLFLESKQLKRLLRNKDFVFCIVAYPTALIVFIILKLYIANTDFETDSRAYYRIISFVGLGFIAILSLFERVEKKFLHKRQGDILKIKQKQGNWKR